MLYQAITNTSLVYGQVFFPFINFGIWAFLKFIVFIEV